MVPNGFCISPRRPTSRRRCAQKIEQQGYTIIENMGDQPSDLLGGHAEKKFLLPDPFYRVP